MVFCGAWIRASARLRSPSSCVALVQAQFDLFWVAAQVSIPFVIAGICLGAMARDQ